MGSNKQLEQSGEFLEIKIQSNLLVMEFKGPKKFSITKRAILKVFLSRGPETDSITKRVDCRSFKVVDLMSENFLESYFAEASYI